MKALLVILSLFYFSGEAWSAGVSTPVQYCASLAATSCEVLNWETVAAGSTSTIPYVLIKYCRNQKAGFAIFFLNISGNLPLVTSVGSGYQYSLGLYSNATRTVQTSMDSASLCSANVALDGSNYYSLLP